MRKRFRNHVCFTTALELPTYTHLTPLYCPKRCDGRNRASLHSYPSDNLLGCVAELRTSRTSLASGLGGGLGGVGGGLDRGHRSRRPSVSRSQSRLSSQFTDDDDGWTDHDMDIYMAANATANHRGSSLVQL